MLDIYELIVHQQIGIDAYLAGILVRKKRTARIMRRFPKFSPLFPIQIPTLRLATGWGEAFNPFF